VGITGVAYFIQKLVVKYGKQKKLPVVQDTHNYVDNKSLATSSSSIASLSNKVGHAATDINNQRQKHTKNAFVLKNDKTNRILNDKTQSVLDDNSAPSSVVVVDIENDQNT